MAVDWQNTEETRQTSGQDNSLVDPTGQSQTHLATTGNTSAVRRLRHTLKRTRMGEHEERGRNGLSQIVRISGV